MGLLKKIDEVFATARYYEELSQRYARQRQLDTTHAEEIVAHPAAEMPADEPAMAA